jgi:ABC-type multidrug transport system ATPase subunit
MSSATATGSEIFPRVVRPSSFTDDNSASPDEGMTVEEFLDFHQKLKNLSPNQIVEFVRRCRDIPGLADFADALEAWAAAREVDNGKT